MDVAEAKRLKALEDENGKLKRLLADATLDVSTLKEILGMEAGEPKRSSQPADASEARFEEDRCDLGHE